MHLKLFTITCCLSLFFLQLDTFAQIRQNTYGGSGDETINAIVPSFNGGYVLCGHTSSSGAGQADVLVMEIDASGSVIWANTYGGINDDMGFDMTPTNDGGYMVVGSSKSVTPFNEQIYALKLEEDGTIDWQRFIGNDNSTEKALAVIQVSLNGYLIGGSLQNGSNPPNAWIGKLRWNGQSLPISKALGNIGVEVINDLQLRPDGIVVATGVESSFTADNENMLLLEIDEEDNGTLNRALSIGGAGQDLSLRHVLTSDGGSLLYGLSLSCGSLTLNETAVKLDNTGTLTWAKTLGTAQDDGILDAVELSDGTFAFGSFSRDGNDTDIQLLRTSPQGDVLSATLYGGEGNDWVMNPESPKKMIAQGTSILTVATTNSFDVSGQDIYLLQADMENPDDCNSEPINISSADCAFTVNVINDVSFSNVPLPVFPDVLIDPVPADFSPQPACCELEAEVAQASYDVCQGNSVALAVNDLMSNGVIQYNWLPSNDLDDGTAAMPQASPTSNTDYFVTITDDTGCTATASMQVVVLPAPTIELGEPINECEGIPITLSVNGIFDNYTWQDNSGAPTFSPTTSGTYALTVTDANGCTATDNIEVSFQSVVNPIIDLGGDTLIVCEGETGILEAGEGFVAYLWSDGSEESRLEVSEAGVYEVAVTTNCGNGAGSIVVALEDCEEPEPTPSNQQRVIVPTAFSPNDDGFNDRVSLFLNQGVELVEFAIYNRSGEPVFQTSDPTASWDGRFKNDEQNIGVYPYYLRAIDRDNRDKQLLVRGNITLIR